jgi:RNA polymerase sigma factor (sigma-70 family)
MVLRVCWRVLGHEQDAEDAFQATFLILARNSGSIRKREAVADWLHGVAYRTAMKAKRSAARRRNHEARLRILAPKVTASPTWDDVQAVLDEEIERLAEPFRAAFVVCVLEGKSGPQAAAELGIKEGTVWSRVTRARTHLRERLARRGIKLSALLAAVSVAESTAGASLPAALASVTVRFGLLVAAGKSAAGVIPTPIAALAAGVTRAMFLTKAKIPTLVLLALSLVAGAAALALPGKAADEPAQPSPDSPGAKPPAGKAPHAPEKDSLTYGGRVLGPDGRPVAGAKLYLTPAWGYLHEPYSSTESGTTGADGRFAFTVPKAKYHDHAIVVAAAAANHGVAWVTVPAGGKRDDLTLRLVEDDVPITGQIVDLQGKPVAGATLTVLQINAASQEDLDPWLEVAQSKKGSTRGRSLHLEQEYLKRFTIAPSSQVTTDAEGRFRLTGIGRNRLVRALLDGPTIVSQYVQILTRPGKTIEVTEHEGRPEYGEPRRVTTYYGANFRHVAAPTKPIVGVVRDKDTKKPLAGVTIRSFTMAIAPKHVVAMVRTTTDAQGRYRLTGMPKGKGNKIRIELPRDLPYVAVHRDVPDSPGLDPVTVDFELKRGVWIEGKITDKVTGQPLQGAVEYFAIYSNANLPNLNDYAGFDGTISSFGVGTKEDGSYRVVGLPGPGLVAVIYLDHYLRAPERDDEYGIKEASLSTSPYHLLHPINYGALARINPAKGADSVKRDVTLDPGRTFTGTVLGPDGKPLAGVRCFGLTGASWWEHERLRTAEFTVRGFNPRRPRDILFQLPEKGLIGVAQPPKGNGDTITVRMEPGAAITGRLVDAEGKPRAGVKLEVWFRLKEDSGFQAFSREGIQTDREGRFRLEALLPGYAFRLYDGKGELDLGSALRSGQTKDLGDVELKPTE